MEYAGAGTVRRARRRARRYVRRCKLSDGQSAPVANGVEQFVNGAPSSTSTMWYAREARRVAMQASLRRYTMICARRLSVSRTPISLCATKLTLPLCPSIETLRILCSSSEPWTPTTVPTYHLLNDPPHHAWTNTTPRHIHAIVDTGLIVNWSRNGCWGLSRELCFEGSHTGLVRSDRKAVLGR